jgi:hypothetical protein
MWAFIFLKNFIGDGGLNSLPYYMAAVGFMIFGDQGGIRGKSWSYSYSGDDWCGEGSGMYVYDDCTRVRGVVAALNKTAGVITIAIGYVFDRHPFPHPLSPRNSRCMMRQGT